MTEAVVVGAGPGGLAAAAMLQREGVRDSVVLERSGSVGASWRRHYDRLHLHTVRWLSNLPGYPIPKPYGKWVARDDVIRYLEEYATRHNLDVRFEVDVRRIDRGDGAWHLQTSKGDWHGTFVVIATGHNHTPRVPDWTGRDDFSGELIHASDYRNAAPYRGRDVVVVGSGNTGAEIATDLVEGGAGTGSTFDPHASSCRPARGLRSSNARHGCDHEAVASASRRQSRRCHGPHHRRRPIALWIAEAEKRSLHTDSRRRCDSIDRRRFDRLP